jgi:hypothetical protein
MEFSLSRRLELAPRCAIIVVEKRHKVPGRVSGRDEAGAEEAGIAYISLHL